MEYWLLLGLNGVVDIDEEQKSLFDIIDRKRMYCRIRRLRELSYYYCIIANYVGVSVGAVCRKSKGGKI